MNTTEKDVREGLPSASSVDRFINCPGSFAAERGLPELPKQNVTSEGTRIHAALESGDTEGLEPTEAEIASRLSAMEKSALADWMRQLGIEETPTRHAEERLWIRDPNTLELEASAQLDVYYVHERVCLVIDAKSGFKGATSAELNWQLMTQAICVSQEYPEVKSFYVAIAHARLGSSFDMAVYDIKGIRHGLQEFRHAQWLSKQPNARRVPGTHCQYCRANGVCVEAAAYSSVTQQEFGVSSLPSKDVKLSIAERVGRMTLPQMAGVFTRSKIAYMIFDQVESRLKSQSAEELAKVGLGFKPGAVQSKVDNYSKARAAAVAAGLTDEQLDACSTLGVPKLREVVKDKLALNKDGAKERTKTILEGHLVETQNQPSLEIIKHEK